MKRTWTVHLSDGQRVTVTAVSAWAAGALASDGDCTRVRVVLPA